MSARNSWLALVFAAAPVWGADPVDYVRDVKPIFAAHCTTCHGPSKQKADLRLDRTPHPTRRQLRTGDRQNSRRQSADPRGHRQ